MSYESTRPQPQSLATPISVIVAGFMIASAIYVSNTQTGYLAGRAGTTAQNNNAAAPSAVQPGAAQPAAAADPEPTEDPNATYTVSVDDDPVLGDANAPITLIEFSDYRCPFCERFHTDAFPQIKKNYIDTGKAKFIYRDLSIHPPQSDDAAAAAHCAADQGKYWDYHGKLFTQFSAGDSFDASTLKKYAGELGLNQASFDSCFDGGKYKDEVSKDYSDARAVTATGTPTMFVGKSTANGSIQAFKLVGAQDYADFAALIDKVSTQ